MGIDAAFLALQNVIVPYSALLKLKQGSCFSCQPSEAEMAPWMPDTGALAAAVHFLMDKHPCQKNSSAWVVVLSLRCKLTASTYCAVSGWMQGKPEALWLRWQ